MSRLLDRFAADRTDILLKIASNRPSGCAPYRDPEHAARVDGWPGRPCLLRSRRTTARRVVHTFHCRCGYARDPRICAWNRPFAVTAPVMVPIRQLQNYGSKLRWRLEMHRDQAVQLARPSPASRGCDAGESIRRKADMANRPLAGLFGFMPGLGLIDRVGLRNRGILSRQHCQFLIVLAQHGKVGGRQTLDINQAITGARNSGDNLV
jgi:hypothetical protein